VAFGTEELLWFEGPYATEHLVVVRPEATLAVGEHTITARRRGSKEPLDHTFTVADVPGPEPGGSTITVDAIAEVVDHDACAYPTATAYTMTLTPGTSDPTGATALHLLRVDDDGGRTYAWGGALPETTTELLLVREPGAGDCFVLVDDAPGIEQAEGTLVCLSEDDDTAAPDSGGSDPHTADTAEEPADGTGTPTRDTGSAADAAPQDQGSCGCGSGTAGWWALAMLALARRSRRT